MTEWFRESHVNDFLLDILKSVCTVLQCIEGRESVSWALTTKAGCIRSDWQMLVGDKSWSPRVVTQETSSWRIKVEDIGVHRSSDGDMCALRSAGTKLDDVPAQT